METLFTPAIEKMEHLPFHDPVNHIRGQVDAQGQWQGNFSFFESENDNHPYKMATYEDGVLHGRSVTFKPNKEGQFLLESGVTYYRGSIVDTMLYKNGILVESYENEVAHRKQGLLWRFQPDGTPMEKGFYANGKKEGITIHYHPDGSYSSEQEFSKGVPHGIEQRYDDSGKRTMYREWANGKQHGSEVKLIEEGENVFEVHSSFVDGIKSGPYKICHQGQTIENGTFQDGHKSGLVQTYDGQTLLSRLHYLQGVPHGFGEYYHIDYMERGNYKDGKREGTWECVNLHINKVFMTKDFKADEAVAYARINKDGKILQRGTYSNGIPVLTQPAIQSITRVNREFSNGQDNGNDQGKGLTY